MVIAQQTAEQEKREQEEQRAEQARLEEEAAAQRRRKEKQARIEALQTKLAPPAQSALQAVLLVRAASEPQLFRSLLARWAGLSSQ